MFKNRQWNMIDRVRIADMKLKAELRTDRVMAQ